ncbi:MAG: protein kinase, partial [Myxococcota bacterium]
MHASDERLPVDFGKYRLEKRIAAGGMAEVFLAHRHDSPHEPLVIKRILPHIGQDKNFVQMFTDEARTAANLAHPNVVRILDLGLVDGAYFLAMEYVHGEDIRRIYNRAYKLQRSLPLSHSIRVIADAAQGLAYAHKLKDPLTGDALGIVHRDVSPQNILVTYAGDAKVVDFGIATAAHKVQQTRAGQVKGKYSYMSPEQAKGEPLDFRTDIFALGIILYETTTGTRLFKRTTELATLQAVMQCEFVPPREALPNYPANLESLLLKTLAEKPDDRWQDGADFSAALYDFLYTSGLYVEKEQVGAFIRDLFADPVSEVSAPPANIPSSQPIALAAAEAEPEEEPESSSEPTVAQRPPETPSQADDAQADDRPATDKMAAQPTAEERPGAGFADVEADSEMGVESTRTDSTPDLYATPPKTDAEASEPPLRRSSTMVVRERAQTTTPDEASQASAVASAPEMSPSLERSLQNGLSEASVATLQPELDSGTLDESVSSASSETDSNEIDSSKSGTSNSDDPVEAESSESSESSWSDDAAPTVSAVPTYRAPQDPVVSVIASDSVTPPDASASIEDRPPVELGADLLDGDKLFQSNRGSTLRSNLERRPSINVPVYSEAAAPAKPPFERTQQVRARQYDERAHRATNQIRTRIPVWVALLIAVLSTLLIVLSCALILQWPSQSPVQRAPIAQLSIMTESDSAIFLSGRSLGMADGRGQAGPFSVPPGTHELRVANPAQGFDRMRAVTLVADQNYFFEVRGRTGWVRVTVSPWAQVSIDGKTMGLTPLPRIGLLEG